MTQLIGKLRYSAVAALEAPIYYKSIQRQPVLDNLIAKNL